MTLHSRLARGLPNLLAPNLLRIPWLRNVVVGSFAGTTLRYGRRGLAGSRATQIPLAEGHVTALLRAGGCVFVRPDGYIAWAGASSDAPDLSGGLAYGRFSSCC